MHYSKQRMKREQEMNTEQCVRGAPQMNVTRALDGTAGRRITRAAPHTNDKAQHPVCLRSGKKAGKRVIADEYSLYCISSTGTLLRRHPPQNALLTLLHAHHAYHSHLPNPTILFAPPNAPPTAPEALLAPSLTAAVPCFAADTPCPATCPAASPPF